MKKNIIFMADVIDSSSKEPQYVANALKELVFNLNSVCSDAILSPMTITLGDEFQGVSTDLDGAVDTILYIENWFLTNNYLIDLRYVVYEGLIETPINTTSSYGMLGSGLTEARKLLTQKGRDREIAEFVLDDNKKAQLLNRLMIAMTGFRELPARQKKSQILSDLLFSKMSDKDIAKKAGKSPSQIWKYRKNWHTESWASSISILKDELYD